MLRQYPIMVVDRQKGAEFKNPYLIVIGYLDIRDFKGGKTWQDIEVLFADYVDAKT